jgi:hypothetical protein
MKALHTQSEARAEAKRLNTDPLPGLIAVAGRYPLNSWGGAEQGWTVYYVVNRELRR